jgi:diguanylate cyclase (GGDEF)-like protein/PAS domain S-box-containing protein
MPEPRLSISTCASFAPDVRAALPAHLQGQVEIVEFAADCAGAQADCREQCEQVHARAAARAELMAGDCVVSVSSRADGADVCALQCSNPSGYPLINRRFAEQLIADGAYLLTPGWARHWKSYLRAQGFDQTLGRQYFHEFAAQLVLLDTGTDPEAVRHLEEMGAYLDLPTRQLPCGLDYLRPFLTGLVLEWKLRRETAAREEADEQASSRQAEYAVTLDMLGALAGVTDEGEVAERVLDLITLLFAPGRLHLLTIRQGRPGGLRSRPPAAAAEAAAVTARLADLTDDYSLTDDGFLLLVGRDDSRAAVDLGAFAVPEKRDDYLNLALALAGAFDLALANARSFGRLERARQELRASDERYRALMDQASDAIVLVDVRGTVLEANGQARHVMGKTRDDVVGRGMDDIHDAKIQSAVQGGFDELMRNGKASIPGIRLTRPGAEDVVVDANFSLVDVAGRRIIQGIFRDVSERERSARELEALSLSDALTGLRNRRGFAILAEQQLKTARRLGRRLLLLFADLDGLKPVNDIQGHAAGDQLLREAAAVLGGCFRDIDIVARMGGDEFAVLQIDSGSGEAPAAVERLAAAVAAANATPGRTCELSLSVGAAAFDPAVPSTLDELLQVADKRMYAVKAARKAARAAKGDVPRG